MFPGAGCATRNDSASSAQVIDGSLRFLQGLQNQNFANYLKRTLSADGNRQTYTFSVWCTRKQLKGMQLGNGYDASTFDLAGTNDFRIEFESSRADALNIFDDGMANNMDVTTNAVYRDTNAWYHIVAAVDTTQGTAADRVKLYVNGVHQTSLATATYPTEDTQGEWNDASYTHYLGQRGTGSLWDGSLAQYYFLDGQALAASDFGYTDQLTNTWRPKKFTGSYGTPGGSAAGGTLPNYNSNAALPTYSNQGGGSSPGGSTSVSDAFDDSGNYCDMTYLNGQWSKLTFDENITNVTNITIGYDGEGDPGYNGGNVQTSVSFNGSRQTIQIYSGGTITLENLYFISQPGSGVCRLYDVTITTSGASATELTFTPPTHNNSFYLPLDGSAPIGQDQSPCENDWTPVNFGGSASLDKATGALPILNTVSGGGVASSGVRTDAFGNNCVLALPLVGTAIDVSNQINSGSTTKAVTTNGDPTASSVQSNFYGGSFDFDATGDYFNTTTSSTDFSFGTGDFTIEAWCYPDSGADNKGMWQLSTTSGGLVAASTTLSANYESDEFYFGSAGGWRNSGKTHADDKWHHVAEVRNGGTIYIYVDGVLDQSWSDTSTYDMTYWAVGGYYTTSYLWSGFMQDFRVYKGVAKYTGNFIPASTNPDIQPISPSGAAYSSELTKPSAGAVGFNDSASSFLQLDTSDDYEFGTGDFSIECWFMLDQLGEQQHLYEGRKSGNAGRVLIYVKTDNKVYFYGDAADRISSRLLSKHIWYHVAVCRVSGTSTLYLDGVSQGTYSDSNDYDKPASYLYIGIDDSPSGSNMGGYISNMRVLKGSAAYSSAFRPSTAPLTNITNTKLLCCQSPIDPTAAAVIATGSITANGFCASPINFNPFDSDIGVVEGRPTGYCTWNPLVRSSAGRGTYKSNNVIFQGTDAWKSTTGTLAVSSGKWYYEQKAYGNMYGTATGNLAMGFGWSKVNEVITDEDFYNNSTQRARATAFFNTGGYNNFSTYVGTVCTPATGDIMATALDKDNNTIKYYLNGVEVVSATLGNTTSELTPFCQCYYDDSYFEANFGQTPFRYTPPEGYQPLCKANLPRPEDAVRPDKVVKVQIWDGNDAQRNIHTYGFQPDLVWFKSRTSTNGQMWIDSVRGAEKCMYAHQNAAEETQAQSLVSFDREGFRMGTFANNNASGESYVAYAWKAGGNTGTFNVDGKDVGSAAAAGLTGGNYTPKACSINTTHGFAILTWDGDLTGAGTKSIAHGLSGFVDAGWMIISKRYSGGTSDWWVQHYSIADNSNVLKLNEYDPKTDISGDGAITTPTDTLFYGNWNSGLAANSNIIGYLWKDVPRIQKFGSYTGNSSADGPYVELGFRPAMLMIKRSASSNANWYMMDIETQSFNAVTEALEPNTHDAMNTSVVNFDFLSNGFKLRGTDGDINSSGVLYIYAAWAHQPEQNLYGAPALAR